MNCIHGGVTLSVVNALDIFLVISHALLVIVGCVLSFSWSNYWIYQSTWLNFSQDNGLTTEWEVGIPTRGVWMLENFNNNNNSWWHFAILQDQFLWQYDLTKLAHAVISYWNLCQWTLFAKFITKVLLRLILVVW